MPDFRMPSLGADMDHGKLVEWLVKPGDYVHRGETVAVVDTDKTVMEIESFEDGVVAELLVEVGTTVPVGTALARITQTPAAVPPPAAASPPVAGPPAPGPPGPQPAATLPAATLPAAPSAEAERAAPSIAPPIRHLAHQLDVDVASLHGSGRRGAVTRADVERAAEARGKATAGAPARVRSSPRARRLAAELGIALGDIVGTGPSGAVREADLRRAAEASPPRPAPPAAPPSGAQPALTQPAVTAPTHARRTAESAAAGKSTTLRRAIASLMTRSKQTIPHYYLSTTLDLRAAMEWMEQANHLRPVSTRLVPAALLLKATAVAASEVPEVNGFFADGEFSPAGTVHLGVAVALRQGGLIAPAIHDAQTLSVDELMVGLRDLVARARSGRLQRAEMADPTLTVTNLGDLGVESVFGVIYPPQVAMVGLGRVREQPWAENGMLGVRRAAVATLSADHRVSDGLRGARFLARIDELLQKPDEL